MPPGFSAMGRKKNPNGAAAQAATAAPADTSGLSTPPKQPEPKPTAEKPGGIRIVTEKIVIKPEEKAPAAKAAAVPKAKAKAAAAAPGKAAEGSKKAAAPKAPEPA